MRNDTRSVTGSEESVSSSTTINHPPPFPVVKVVGDNLEFTDELAGYIRDKWVLDDAGLGFHTVSIIGSQGSGKSTLLNCLFGTCFQVRDPGQLGPTTKGIWMSRAQNNNVLVTDVQGMDDYPFDIGSTLFALATSSVIIFNVWEHQAGLYTGANMDLLKITFEMKLRSFDNTRKSTIMMAVRDHDEDVPQDLVRKTMDEGFRNIWDNIKKPVGSEDASLGDLFNFQFVTLPHRKLKPKEFAKKVSKLRRSVFEKHNGAHYALNYTQPIPIYGYHVFCLSSWNQVLATVASFEQDTFPNFPQDEVEMPATPEQEEAAECSKDLASAKKECEHIRLKLEEFQLALDNISPDAPGYPAAISSALAPIAAIATRPQEAGISTNAVDVAPAANARNDSDNSTYTAVTALSLDIPPQNATYPVMTPMATESMKTTPTTAAPFNFGSLTMTRANMVPGALVGSNMAHYTTAPIIVGAASTPSTMEPLTINSTIGTEPFAPVLSTPSQSTLTIPITAPLPPAFAPVLVTPSTISADSSISSGVHCCNEVVTEREFGFLDERLGRLRERVVTQERVISNLDDQIDRICRYEHVKFDEAITVCPTGGCRSRFEMLLAKIETQRNQLYETQLTNIQKVAFEKFNQRLVHLNERVLLKNEIVSDLGSRMADLRRETLDQFDTQASRYHLSRFIDAKRRYLENRLNTHLKTLFDKQLENVRFRAMGICKESLQTANIHYRDHDMESTVIKHRDEAREKFISDAQAMVLFHTNWTYDYELWKLDQELASICTIMKEKIMARSTKLDSVLDTLFDVVVDSGGQNSPAKRAYNIAMRYL